MVPNSIANVLEGHTANIKAVRFIGAEGKHLVSGSRFAESLSALRSPLTIALENSDNTVRIWATATSNNIKTMRGHRSRIWDVDATTKGDRVASASGDRTVKVWNWQTEDVEGQCATTLEGNMGDVYAARWHPMGVESASLLRSTRR